MCLKRSDRCSRRAAWSQFSVACHRQQLLQRAAGRRAVTLDPFASALDRHCDDGGIVELSESRQEVRHEVDLVREVQECSGRYGDGGKGDLRAATVHEIPQAIEEQEELAPQQIELWPEALGPLPQRCFLL
jgi:hypothetical protein